MIDKLILEYKYQSLNFNSPLTLNLFISLLYGSPSNKIITIIGDDECLQWASEAQFTPLSVQDDNILYLLIPEKSKIILPQQGLAYIILNIVLKAEDISIQQIAKYTSICTNLDERLILAAFMARVDTPFSIMSKNTINDNGSLTFFKNLSVPMYGQEAVQAMTLLFANTKWAYILKMPRDILRAIMHYICINMLNTTHDISCWALEVIRASTGALTRISSMARRCFDY